MADKSSEPIVSIVCAWFNRAEYIKDTIDSLLGQDYDSFEVVVVNDGSTDPRVKEILDCYTDARLRVIHQDNAGFVYAIRRAIASSRGRYIAIQGAGDVSYPKRISAQVAALDADPSICGVACRRMRVTIGGPADGASSASDPVPEYVDLDYLLENENPINHGDVTFRRSAYDAVGGYRTFFKFAQDIDLFIRMARSARFRILDDVLYERRVFFGDGIANNRPKMIHQRALLEFAKQCERDRRIYGRDMLEIYGESGGLFATSIRIPLSRFIAILAIQYLAIGELEAALHYSRLATGQAKTLHSLAARAACLASRNALGKSVTQGMLRLHPKYASWIEKN